MISYWSRQWPENLKCFAQGHSTVSGTSDPSITNLISYHWANALLRSPEPLAHGELLWSSIVRRLTCVVCRQQLLQKTSSPKQLAGFWPNLAGMILIWPSLIILQMILVHCISRSHRLKIDFQDENFKNLLVWNQKAWSLDIWYVASPCKPLPSLFKLYPWGQKMAPPRGVTCFT